MSDTMPEWYWSRSNLRGGYELEAQHPSSPAREYTVIRGAYVVINAKHYELVVDGLGRLLAHRKP